MFKSEYFASPIYYEDKKEWVDKINKICDPHIETARKNLEEENQVRIKEWGFKNDIGQVYHSSGLEPEPDLQFFHSYIAKKSRWALDNMGYDMDHYNLIFTESWVQEFSHNGAGHHWFHTHPNSHISGFLFLKASIKTSRPFFQDPRVAHVPLKLKEKDPNKVTNANDLIHYNVKPGTLMIFPAYMSHAYMVDLGLEPFRFLHFNMRAVEKNVLSSFALNSAS